MRIPRVYTDQDLSVGARIELEKRSAHHLLRVLRLPAGASVRVFDGRGEEYAGHTLGTTLPLTVELGQQIDSRTESPLRITIAQAVAKGERMDYALQKCVELGVTAVQPLFTRRSVVRLEADRLQKREAHWRGVILAASEQSGRTVCPRLLPTRSLADWLRNSPAHAASAWILDPRAESSLATVTRPDGETRLIVGPEGGLDEEEIQAARHVGYLGVRLGPRILRTETAATVALSILQARFGDLG